MEDIKNGEVRAAGLRDVLSPPEQTHSLLCAVLFLLSCFVLAASDVPNLCAMYLLACVVYYYMLTRSVRGLILYAVPVFLLYVLSGMLPAIPTPMLLPACFLCLTVGGGCGGFLLTHAKSVRQWLPLCALPVVAWGAVFLVTGDPLRGLLVLIPTAVAAVSAFCLLKTVPRTASTLTIAATLTVSLGIAALVTLAATHTLSAEGIAALAQSLREGVIGMYTEMEALYAERGMTLGLSVTDIGNAAVLFVNVLPGLFLAACGVTAFFVWRTLLQELLAFRSLPRLPLVLSGMTVSRLCALLFLAASLLAMIANTNTATLFGTICQNLSLVLTPPLALIGFTSLLPGAGARSCLSALLGVALLFLLFYNFITAISLSAMIGAVQVLIHRPKGSADGSPPKNDNHQ